MTSVEIFNMKPNNLLNRADASSLYAQSDNLASGKSPKTYKCMLWGMGKAAVKYSRRVLWFWKRSAMYLASAMEKCIAHKGKKKHKSAIGVHGEVAALYIENPSDSWWRCVDIVFSLLYLIWVHHLPSQTICWPINCRYTNGMLANLHNRFDQSENLICWNENSLESKTKGRDHQHAFKDWGWHNTVRYMTEQRKAWTSYLEELNI